MKNNILSTISLFKDLAPLIISFVAIYLSSNYQKHTKKIANDKMMKELFSEFNQRYDIINNNLDTVSRLSTIQWDELDLDEKAEKSGVVIDFFNICAEEYYWHKEGRINGNIWKSWTKGMNDIFDRSEVIQNIWKEECVDEGYKSYYISKRNDIFKNA